MTRAMTRAIEINSPINPVIDLVLDGVGERTRAEYRRALSDFVLWYHQTNQLAFNKASVTAHVAALKAAGVPASSINQRLSAIRKLALEAADNELISEGQAQAIQRVRGVRVVGRKTGNWLSKRQAEQLLNLPDAATHKGRRDRAILAVMIGCGLRREEVSRLTVAHLQQRNERWVILNLSGKRGRVRTVPMAAWVKRLVVQWVEGAGLGQGPLFVRIRRGDHLQPGALTSQAIWNVVEQYAGELGLRIAPHDLRRTFAKLAYQGGSPIEQIQQSLGHASIKTTEAYLGIDQDFDFAPSDAIQLRV
jgi:site-specific recombinase XerD